MEKLLEFATKFRTAIETVPRHGFPIGLIGFPYGSCGDASQILGEALRNAGLGEFRYLVGFYPNSDRSHAWIEQDGIVVDVTADQFGQHLPPIIVSSSSEWHKAFEDVKDEGVAQLDGWTGPSMHQMEWSYKQITEHMARL